MTVLVITTMWYAVFRRRAAPMSSIALSTAALLKRPEASLGVGTTTKVTSEALMA